MAMNRLGRDTIINNALDLADSPFLDNHDRPSSPTIVSTAFAITWLQEAIDYFQKKFPFSTTIATSTVTLATDATSFSVPSDFILDYNNGVVLDDDKGRLVRRGLGAILNRPTSSKGVPRIYSVKGATVHIWPKTDQAYTGKLYYYQLSAALASATVPTFPDDYILVQYVWLKAQEYHRVVQIGTALQYANDRIAELQRAGIGSEAEEDVIGIDPLFASQPTQDPTSWMGSTAL